jgi:hypothetical protein
MFSNIPDGQRLIMYGGGEGAPRLDGVYLRHSDGRLLFTVEPTDPSGKERPELPKRYNITSYHLKGYYNKYVGKCKRDLWDMLLMGDGPQEATSLADMEKRGPVAPVSLLPAIPGLPAPLEVERKRILEQLEKWRQLTAAYETVKRLESRFAAHDEAALAKATAKEERYLQHRMMELTIARGGVKLSQERLAALKAKKDARAAELAAAKGLIAALPI